MVIEKKDKKSFTVYALIVLVFACCMGVFFIQVDDWNRDRNTIVSDGEIIYIYAFREDGISYLSFTLEDGTAFYGREKYYNHLRIGDCVQVETAFGQIRSVRLLKEGD
ncbi:MAG: hypothetical protein ACTSPB_01320 [Candidatus Thorarchaeota archaeon]